MPLRNTRQNFDWNVAEARAWCGGSKSPPPTMGSKYQPASRSPGSSSTLARTATNSVNGVGCSESTLQMPPANPSGANGSRRPRPTSTVSRRWSNRTHAAMSSGSCRSSVRTNADCASFCHVASARAENPNGRFRPAVPYARTPWRPSSYSVWRNEPARVSGTKLGVIHPAFTSNIDGIPPAPPRAVPSSVARRPVRLASSVPLEMSRFPTSVSWVSPLVDSVVVTRQPRPSPRCAMKNRSTRSIRSWRQPTTRFGALGGVPLRFQLEVNSSSDAPMRPPGGTYSAFNRKSLVPKLVVVLESGPAPMEFQSAISDTPNPERARFEYPAR